MIHPARPTAEATTPLPDLVLYGRDGCHLCDETRSTLHALLVERRAAGLPAPNLVERDITTDPELERRFLALIPVVELGDQSVELAISPATLRRLLADALDGG